jgi:FERM/RhoGEF/pleckstrin domain protein 2
MEETGIIALLIVFYKGNFIIKKLLLLWFSALLVAANSQEEKDKWLEDILQAVQSARELPEDASRLNYFSLKSCSKENLLSFCFTFRVQNYNCLLPFLNLGSSEEVLDKTGAFEDSRPNGADGKERTQQQRSNTTVHVCWHRNTSISTRDHLLALEV